VKQCSKGRIVFVRIARDSKTTKLVSVAVPIEDSQQDSLEYAKSAHPKDEVIIVRWGDDPGQDGEPEIYISNMGGSDD
jgi:hypothetical protein